jgi:ribosomal protein L19
MDQQIIPTGEKKKYNVRKTIINWGVEVCFLTFLTIITYIVLIPNGFFVWNGKRLN